MVELLFGIGVLVAAVSGFAAGYYFCQSAIPEIPDHDPEIHKSLAEIGRKAGFIAEITTNIDELVGDIEFLVCRPKAPKNDL